MLPATGNVRSILAAIEEQLETPCGRRPELTPVPTPLPEEYPRPEPVRSGLPAGMRYARPIGMATPELLRLDDFEQRAKHVLPADVWAYVDSGFRRRGDQAPESKSSRGDIPLVPGH